MRHGFKKNISYFLIAITVASSFVSHAVIAEESSLHFSSAIDKERQLFDIEKGPVTRMNLDECVDRVLTANPDMDVADESIRGAREKINEASKLGYPIFDYEYTLGPAPRDAENAASSFFSGDITVLNRVKIGVGVPIHTFGKVKTGKSLARTGVEAEEKKKLQKQTELILKIKQLYYGILLAREVSGLLKQAVGGLHDQINKREKDTANNNPTETIKLKLFKAELEKRLEETDKKEILALQAMKVQLALDPKTRFDIAGSKLTPKNFRLGTYEQYRQKAMNDRVDLQLIQIGYQAKSQQAQLEKRLMTPNLAVGSFFELGRAPGVRNITATDDYNNPFNYTRAGIGFQLKGQLDFHSSLSKIHQIESEMAKIGIQKNYAQEGIDLEVKEAFLDVRNTKLDMNRADESAKLARQFLFLTQSNMDIGLGEVKDYVDALGAFLQTRGQYFEAVFNFNVALAKLQQKTGELR